jgi:16S rRNA (cytosine967-C5)-methyltransferase
VARVAPPYADDPLGNLAVSHSHPRWIVSAFRDALGGSLEATAWLLAADNAAPTVTLVARPGRSTVDELIAAGAQPTKWSPYGAVLPGGDPGDLAAVRDGRAAVQDEGSQLVALALANAAVDGRDEWWLDLCAGPGGKAALLGAVARQRGAHLLANEVSRTRAGLVARTAGPDADVVVGDGRQLPWLEEAFDRVLVDAPCTGLGALRRRPEARWRRRPEDLPGLRGLQQDLLAAGLRSVRSGGVVAYVTCSPHLAETRVVVDDVLRRGGAERLDARELLPGVTDLGEGPDVQLWPHLHGTDAMFLSVLRKL